MRRTALRAKRVMCLALLSVCALPPRHASASDLRLEWSAPPECPSRSELLARLAELTDHALQSTSTVEVGVTRRATTYRAHIVVLGPSGFGERSLENPRCDVLADSIALLLALSLPNRAAVAPQVSASLGASLEGRVLVGALPLPAAGAGAAIFVDDVSSLRFELHGAYYLPQSTSFDGMETLGARFKLLTFGACVCRIWSFAGLALGPCLGAEVHWMKGSGAGGMPSLSGSTSWWGPSLRLLGRVRIVEALGIRLVVEGMLPMSRPRFVFQDVGELHRVSEIALQALLGPEVRF